MSWHRIFERFLERRLIIDKVCDVAVGLIVAMLLALAARQPLLNFLRSDGPPRLPPTPTPDVKTGTVRSGTGQPLAKSFYGTCTDRNGTTGDFRAIAFLHQLNWRYEEDSVELAGRPTEEERLASLLREEGIRSALGESGELIAVGTSSCQGEQRNEEDRALNRAKVLSTLASGILPVPPNAPALNAHLLNLGQFNPDRSPHPCDAAHERHTREQRKVILVAVDRRGTNLDLESCLRQVFQKDPFLRSLLENYSKFELNQHWSH